MKRKTAALLLALLLAAGCAPSQETQRSMFIMDTVVTIKLYGLSDCSGLLDGAFELAQRLSGMLDCHGSGELARLNGSGGAKVSDELLEAVTVALEICRASEGAFDITVRPLAQLWDFRSEKVPAPQEIAAALESVDYRRVTVTGNYIDLGGTSLDLGGSAKGYICDRVRDYLKENGVKSAVLDFGGNICCIGDKDGTGFNIGIADPEGGDPVASVKAADCAVVTSGIYQRFFEKDGVRYHHILDTGTGYPVENELASVSVVCRDAAVADCLSTAMLALGTQEAKRLADMYGAEAVFVFRDGTTENYG